MTMFGEDDRVDVAEEDYTAPACDYVTPGGNKWCCGDERCQRQRDGKYGRFGPADGRHLRHCSYPGCHEVVEYRGAPLRCECCKRCYCDRHSEDGFGEWHGAQEWSIAEWYCPECVAQGFAADPLA